MAKASEIKTGNFIHFKGELVKVESYTHRTPGNLRAFYQATMRSIKSGKLQEHRFRPDEEVDIARIESKQFQFLYKNQNELVLMDIENYEQINVDENLIGAGAKFLYDNMIINISLENDIPVSVELPNHVELQISYAEPAVKGNTATNATKLARLENGTEINVPLFINEGDTIKIDTNTGAYLERTKTNKN
ncbi:MAG: elongation factor P [Solitalea-like symbiont of Tyrophagus putrescentiae]